MVSSDVLNWVNDQKVWVLLLVLVVPCYSVSSNWPSVPQARVLIKPILLTLWHCSLRPCMVLYVSAMLGTAMNKLEPTSVECTDRQVSYGVGFSEIIGDSGLKSGSCILLFISGSHQQRLYFSFLLFNIKLNWWYKEQSRQPMSIKCFLNAEWQQTL